MWWIIVGLLVIVALVYFLGIGPYNGLVRLRNQVQEAWQQIDVELNRRYDLIPNLVETVRGYAGHEQDTLENVIRLRNEAQAASNGAGAANNTERAAIEGQLSGAVTQFLALSENYPDLKANENFRDLQRQLVDTEDRISNGRRYYNAVVSNYNTKIESFPSNLVAGAGNFERATYFEVKDPLARTAPQVSFDDSVPPPQRSTIQDGRSPLEPPALATPGNDTEVGNLPGEQPARPDVQFEPQPGLDGQTRLGG